jgi:hypothetical protein
MVANNLMRVVAGPSDERTLAQATVEETQGHAQKTHQLPSRRMLTIDE